MSVKGTATPTTTVKLKNNGEELDSVKIGGDGKFSFLTVLTEGENSLTVASTYDGENSVESEAVKVTLDTTKPELNIESPKDGDILNEKTIIVEGTASDANLDHVEINGKGVNYRRRRKLLTSTTIEKRNEPNRCIRSRYRRK